MRDYEFGVQFQLYIAFFSQPYWLVVIHYLISSLLFISFTCICVKNFVLTTTSRVVIIGSVEALPILCVRYFRWERERERDTDRERRKWRHHCRAKIGDEIALSLAKISHFSFLPSHFPSLPSRRGHHGGAEIRNEFTLSIAKVFSPSGFVPPLSNGTSRATSDQKPKTNDQILPSPIFLPIEKMNQINTKIYWK